MLDPKRILIETDRWIAIQKLPGELVVADRFGKEENILLHFLGEYLRSQGHKADKSGRDLYPVHRLDRGTSGVVLFAKDQELHRELSMAFEAHQMKKTYWAYTRGIPQWDNAVCRVSLERAEGKAGRGRAHIALNKGKEAETEFKVVEKFGDIAWIEAMPKSGRLHQIRLHLDLLGNSILNDVQYGNLEWKSKFIEMGKNTRMMLHARSISFYDKFQEKDISIDCPLDQELRELVNALNLFKRSTKSSG